MLLQSLLSPRGEMKRGKFFFSILLALAIALAILFIPNIVTMILSGTSDTVSSAASTTGKLVTASVYILGLLFALYAYSCLGVKRLRNMGASPWLVITLYVPYLNLFALLFFMIYPSKKQEVSV